MEIVRTSPVTGQDNTREINITMQQLGDYKNGRGLIQNIMPNISDNDREFIMTGMTPEDWDNMFGKGEYDEAD